jgi:serine/threonine-protein kinase
MGLLGGLKSILGGSKVDIEARFERLRQAVSGSMSQFYMARDRKTGQVVGLKILDPKKTAHFESRFTGLKKPGEGEIAASIHHPNIVRTIEYGTTTRNEPYIVMEYLEGIGVNSLIIGRSKKLDGKRLLIIRQAAEALQAVHDAGYIHRDFCPRNLVASPDLDKVTLIDFGLAVPSTTPFLQPGNRTGTPNYMAPEIIRRRQTDHRVDVFAFGVTAFAIFAYELPWSGGTTGKAAMNHDTQPPVDIFRLCSGLNPKLGQTIMRCLASSPEKRPSSLNEFLQTISGVTQEVA